MIKRIMILISLVWTFILFSACDLGPYTVTFDTQGGATIESQTIPKDGLAVKPDGEPYISSLSDKYFDGWYSIDGEKWNFNTKTVTSDVTIIAHWKNATTALTYSNNIVTGCSSSVTGELVIPAYHNGIKIIEIADNAFDGQGLMTAAFFPSTISSIGESIFTGSSDLIQLTVQATNPPLLNQAIDILNGNGSYTIYVPAKSVNVYKETTPWSTYEPILYGF